MYVKDRCQHLTPRSRSLRAIHPYLEEVGQLGGKHLFPELVHFRQVIHLFVRFIAQKKMRDKKKGHGQ